MTPFGVLHFGLLTVSARYSHDGKHLASDGKTSIKGSDCNACHIIVSQGAGAELEKVTPAGVPFFHIDSEYLEPDCSNCHNGQKQPE